MRRSATDSPSEQSQEDGSAAACSRISAASPASTTSPPPSADRILAGPQALGQVPGQDHDPRRVATVALLDRAALHDGNSRGMKKSRRHRAPTPQEPRIAETEERRHVRCSSPGTRFPGTNETARYVVRHLGAGAGQGACHSPRSSPSEAPRRSPRHPGFHRAALWTSAPGLSSRL